MSENSILDESREGAAAARGWRGHAHARPPGDRDIRKGPPNTHAAHAHPAPGGARDTAASIRSTKDSDAAREAVSPPAIGRERCGTGDPGLTSPPPRERAGRGRSLVAGSSPRRAARAGRYRPLARGATAAAAAAAAAGGAGGGR